MGLVDVDEHAHRAAGIPVAVVVVPRDVMIVVILLVPIAVVIAAIVMAGVPHIICPQAAGACGHQKDGQDGGYEFAGNGLHTDVKPQAPFRFAA